MSWKKNKKSSHDDEKPERGGKIATKKSSAQHIVFHRYHNSRKTLNVDNHVSLLSSQGNVRRRN